MIAAASRSPFGSMLALAVLVLLGACGGVWGTVGVGGPPNDDDDSSGDDDDSVGDDDDSVGDDDDSSGDDDDSVGDDDDSVGDDDDSVGDDDDSVPDDADGDGYDSLAAGGTDCDDGNPLVYPEAAENPSNGLDDDCDGTIDEDLSAFSISPDDALAGGGAFVVITGHGLTGVTSVSIGGTPSTDVDVEDDETIELLADGGPVGVHDVVVTNPYGSVTLAGAFTYTGTATTLDDAVLDAASESTLSLGQSSPSYTATIFEPGVTDGPGQGAGILGEIGLGPVGLEPTYLPDSWVWFAAGYSFGASGGDVYSGSVTPPTYGSYAVTFRFSDDGGLNWLYADTDGGSVSWEDLNVVNVVP